MGKKHKAVSDEITTISGPWCEMLLICRKCSRKLDGGFGSGSKESLPDAFKHVLRAMKRRRDVRIVEVGCLGVCPKGAVTVVRGSTPEEMLLIPEGFELENLANRLLSQPGNPPSQTNS